MIERTFYHSKEESPPLPCVTRIHVEKGKSDWHLIVFVNNECAGVLTLAPDCAQALIDLLLPPNARLEGVAKSYDQT